MLRAASLAAVAAAGVAAPPVQQTARQAVAHGATKAAIVLVDHGHVYTGSQPHVADPARMRFRIGSITKTFTATIVLQLVQEKKVSLDAPLTRYLPWTGAKAKPIRIRDLLDHRSGLADYTTFPLWLTRADRSASTRPRAVLKFVLAQPLVFRPGHGWRYSNSNYVALGLVIEAVTKHTYAQELDRRILRPLHLGATTLPTTRQVQGLADPGTNPWVPWAAGALVSDASDLARFYTALLGGKLFSKATLHEMEQTVPAGNGSDGLGIFAAHLSCGIAWGHDGGILDYYSRVIASADGKRVLVEAARGALTAWSAAAPLLCR
jgi:D-alanyl-D-alanine carboxypeptidase